MVKQLSALSLVLGELLEHKQVRSTKHVVIIMVDTLVDLHIGSVTMPIAVVVLISMEEEISTLITHNT